MRKASACIRICRLRENLSEGASEQKAREQGVHGQCLIQLVPTQSPAGLKAASFFGHDQHVLKECSLIPAFVQAEGRDINPLPEIKVHSKVNCEPPWDHGVAFISPAC